MKLTPLQKSIFDELAKGTKLHELLRKPGMPSWAEFERWRQQSAFNRRYERALSAAERLRGQLIGLDEVSSTSRLPAVLRGPRGSERQHPAPAPAPAPAPEVTVPIVVEPVVTVAPKEKFPKKTTRFFYLERQAGEGLPARVKFVYARNNAAGKLIRVYFVTEIAVLPTDWNPVTKHINPSADPTGELNEELNLIHSLALTAIEEAKTQDEIRAILDLPLTGTSYHKPASKEDVSVAVAEPLPEPAPSQTSKFPVEVDSSVVTALGPLTLPLPPVIDMPETPAPANPAIVLDTEAPSTVGILLAQLFAQGNTLFLTSDGQVFTDEPAALAGAWKASASLQQPVTISRIAAPALLGTISATTAALS
jgi:hypothetical protein